MLGTGQCDGRACSLSAAMLNCRRQRQHAEVTDGRDGFCCAVCSCVEREPVARQHVAGQVKALRERITAYAASWLGKILGRNTKAIFSAVSKTQETIEYLMNLAAEHE